MAANVEEDGLLEDMKFDAELDGFFSGTGGTVNLSPQSFGNPTDDGAIPTGTMPKAPTDEGNGSATAAAAMGAAAFTAAATAGAVGSALMGGNLSVAQSVLGEAVKGAANAAVPTSLQPVKEQAGRFLQKAQPWKDFLLPLSVPAASDGCSRLTANIYSFQTNYAILFVIQLVLAIVLQPSALISVVVTVIVWIFFLKKNDDPEWAPVVGGMPLGPMQRWLLMTALTVIILLFFAGSAIFNAALMYLLCAFAHGIVHDPSAKGIPASENPPVTL
mmetsp:Transcript_56134/g.112524  ORF Transcript_56134/g.112524 Transcript_56134/m.112524 type:complete len:274 (+) Transcript_56134:65-886(+)